MDEWLVGGALALVGVAYVAWDVRNSLRRRNSHNDGGSDGDSSDGGSDGGGGGDGGGE